MCSVLTEILSRLDFFNLVAFTRNIPGQVVINTTWPRPATINFIEIIIRRPTNYPNSATFNPSVEETVGANSLLHLLPHVGSRVDSVCLDRREHEWGDGQRARFAEEH